MLSHELKKSNGKIIKNQISIYKHKPKNSVERQLHEISKLDKRQRKKLLRRQYAIMCFLDIIIILIDTIVVTALYFEVYTIKLTKHFNYLHNNFKLESRNNLVRIVCLLLSLITCVLLVIKRQNIRYVDNMKFMLNNKNSTSNTNIFCTLLVIEIVLHLTQPLPYYSLTFQLVILGKAVEYNLDMFLFCLAVFRFYFLYYFFFYWLMFSSERSKRIM